MPDESKLRKRVLLRLFGSPLVLTPALVGLSAAAVSWALNWRPSLGIFAGLAGLMASVGVYLTRVILDNGKTAREVMEALEREQRAAWEAALDDLDRRLVSADQDPRPEAALRDLRALLRAFEETADRAEAEHLMAVVDVRSRARQLFDSSVRSLEQTMKLYATARQLQLAAARQPLLEKRERIIADVQAGIRQLGATLVALQGLGTGDQAKGELARLREELDQSLQLAGRVESRLSSLLEAEGADAGAVESSLRLQAEPHVKGT